jgi:UDP-3-O-[3-hydroxymyristoyl] glucosamine N-acyltransferase
VWHNVTIGEGTILVAQSGIAGSTRLGRAVILAGQAGASGHLVVGDRCIVGAKSAVLRDLPPGSFVVGHPAIDHRQWKRAQAVWGRLPDLLHRVARLETHLKSGGGQRARNSGGKKVASRAGRGRRTRGNR